MNDLAITPTKMTDSYILRSTGITVYPTGREPMDSDRIQVSKVKGSPYTFSVLPDELTTQEAVFCEKVKEKFGIAISDIKKGGKSFSVCHFNSAMTLAKKMPGYYTIERVGLYMWTLSLEKKGAK